MTADKVTVRIDPMSIVEKFFTEEQLHDRIWEAATTLSEALDLDPLENKDFPEMYNAIKSGFDSYKEYTGHISALGALTLTVLLDTGYIALTISPEDTDEEHMATIIKSLSARIAWAMLTVLAQTSDKVGLVENERFSLPKNKNKRSIPFTFTIIQEEDNNGD